VAHAVQAPPSFRSLVISFRFGPVCLAKERREEKKGEEKKKGYYWKEKGKGTKKKERRGLLTLFLSLVLIRFPLRLQRWYERGKEKRGKGEAGEKRRKRGKKEGDKRPRSFRGWTCIR